MGSGATLLRLQTAETFIGFPCLVTLGIKLSRPVPWALVRFVRLVEPILSPLRRLLAMRGFIVLEKPSDG